MLGLGWTEILVIAVVALIVVGPKDLPKLLGQIGRSIGTIRRMGNEFRREFNKAVAIDEVKDLRKSITDPLNAATAEIRREFSGAPKPGVTPVKPASTSATTTTPSIVPGSAMTPLPAAAKPAATASVAVSSELASVPAIPVEAPKRAKAAPRKSAASAVATEAPQVSPVTKPATAAKPRTRKPAAVQPAQQPSEPSAAPSTPAANIEAAKS